MSIQGFSQPQADLVLWSADTIHAPHEVRAFLSARMIWFIPCFGAYKGATELSYLTTLADFEAIRPMFCTGQESILVLGSKDSRNRHRATLVYLDGFKPLPDGFIATRTEDLGRLYSVPIAEAHKRDAWTIPLHQADPFGELKGFITGFPDIHGDIKPAPDMGDEPIAYDATGFAL